MSAHGPVPSRGDDDGGYGGSPAVPARLRDVVRVGAVGLRTRPLRAFLSALGIAIGIGAMVSVVGISSSSQAELNETLDALGTNLLTVTPVRLTGGQAELPLAAESMVRRIGPVQALSAIGRVDDTTSTAPTGSPRSKPTASSRTRPAPTCSPPSAATIRSGRWLDAATGTYPATVLGSAAAERLGISRSGPDTKILIGNRGSP